ncbi:MAG: hypothetical protein M4579_000742 [Chaenotheca gracillima]|nr:MAG: hypothetical protein M4579_000742 [Chaenotheca gracillima]
MVKCPDPHSGDTVWQYCPSMAPAILFAILFGLVSAAHLVKAYVYRKSFCVVIVGAAMWETVGFILRIFSILYPDGLGLYIPHQMLIILAPLWINAFVYMTVGRMMYFYMPEQKILGLRAERLTICFVFLDFVALAIQSGGGSSLSQGDEKSRQIGIDVYMVGVGLQQLFVLMFFFVTYQFQHKACRMDTGRSTNWKPLLCAVYAVLNLITTRIVYRIIEFANGVWDYVPTHEAFFYCLDALPMFAALCVFLVWHPGKYLVGPDSEFPKRNGIWGRRKNDSTALQEDTV